jgi:ABC-type dipeptide/oligopeptide/nickel transport system permease subunit
MTTLLQPPDLQVETSFTAAPALAPHGQRTLRKLVRQPGAAFAIGYLVFLVVAALVPFLAPYGRDAVDVNAILRPPDSVHLLGTDDLGRDVLTRMWYGTGTTMVAAMELVAGAGVLGCMLGLVSGYFGGWFDYLLMRLVDAALSVPPIVTAMAVVGVLGPGLTPAMVGLSLSLAPSYARLVRTLVVGLREETFLEACRSLGLSHRRMIVRHVLPNIAPVLVVQICLTLGAALLAQGALDFLGLSIQPPIPSWGNSLQRAFRFILQAGWLIYVPGLAITLTVLALNILGDSLRNALSARS